MGVGVHAPRESSTARKASSRPPRLTRPTHGPFVLVLPGGSIPDTTRLAHEEMPARILVDFKGLPPAGWVLGCPDLAVDSCTQENLTERKTSVRKRY